MAGAASAAREAGKTTDAIRDYKRAVEERTRLLGELVYHPGKNRFTRLDIVALGNVRGRPNGENIVGERLGKENPLGIAFELVTDPQPADLLPPRGARDEPSARPDLNLVERYLDGGTP